MNYIRKEGILMNKVKYAFYDEDKNLIAVVDDNATNEFKNSILQNSKYNKVITEKEDNQ